MGLDEAKYRAAERRLWDSVGLEPSERRVHLEHLDVEVRVQEIGEGPPVVLIHGASNGGASWANLVRGLTGSGASWSTGPAAA
jgi:pimeloyl-ACP methyl ester carboxylesterase